MPTVATVGDADADDNEETQGKMTTTMPRHDVSGGDAEGNDDDANDVYDYDDNDSIIAEGAKRIMMAMSIYDCDGDGHRTKDAREEDEMKRKAREDKEEG